MSKEAVANVVQQAISDAGFRRQLSTDPTGALRGFDLTAAETEAIRSGDSGRLSILGVDQRMSKLFALGGASLGASRQAGADLSGGQSAFDPGVGSAFNSADSTGQGGTSSSVLTSGTDPNAALIDDGMSGARARIIPTDPGGILTTDAVDASRSDGPVDESGAYLTRGSYDSTSAARAVTDAHDRQGSGQGVASVTDAHDRHSSGSDTGQVTATSDAAADSTTADHVDGGPEITP
jgi:hypothetical protein